MEKQKVSVTFKTHGKDGASTTTTVAVEMEGGESISVKIPVGGNPSQVVTVLTTGSTGPSPPVNTQSTQTETGTPLVVTRSRYYGRI